MLFTLGFRWASGPGEGLLDATGHVGIHFITDNLRVRNKHIGLLVNFSLLRNGRFIAGGGEKGLARMGTRRHY